MSKLNKIKLGNTTYDIGADWENITNKPAELTREQIIEIIEDLYPEATQQEVEDMADDILENYSNVTEDIIEVILSNDSSDEGSGGSPISLDGYATLQSPHFTGIPTAPTALYGTNTTQIATTAFVQQAIKPTIMVTVNNMPSNVNGTVTATLTGSNSEYSVTETLSSSGIANLELDYMGEYTITFNQAEIKGNSSININIPKMYIYDAIWTEAVTYTVLIDTTNSNTNTACTYADGALEMTKGSSDWDNKPIFKNIRPCVFLNGQVNYYLNPNNWNEKYGTNEASILTGEDGDVMIEFPKFAYKIKTENNIVTVSVSNDDDVIENDNDYTYDAFTRLEEGDLNFFYKGAFKGSLDGDGKLRSISGAKPADNQNMNTFRTAAQANGAHYQQSTYAQLKALQCLYLIKYGNRNGQSALGKGVSSSGQTPLITGYNTENIAEAATSNSTLGLGMNYGNINLSSVHMRLFGIEDFWGNINEWIDGVEIDENRNIILSNNWSNETGLIITTSSISTNLTNNITGYMKQVIGNTKGGFLPIETGGSSSTYWADKIDLSNSSALFFGGTWADTVVQIGPFASFARRPATIQATTIGARLSYI